MLEKIHNSQGGRHCQASLTHPGFIFMRIDVFWKGWISAKVGSINNGYTIFLVMTPRGKEYHSADAVTTRQNFPRRYFHLSHAMRREMQMAHSLNLNTMNKTIHTLLDNVTKSVSIYIHVLAIEVYNRVIQCHWYSVYEKLY